MVHLSLEELEGFQRNIPLAHTPKFWRRVAAELVRLQGIEQELLDERQAMQQKLYNLYVVIEGLRLRYERHS